MRRIIQWNASFFTSVLNQDGLPIRVLFNRGKIRSPRLDLIATKLKLFLDIDFIERRAIEILCCWFNSYLEIDIHRVSPPTPPQALKLSCYKNPGSINI